METRTANIENEFEFESYDFKCPYDCYINGTSPMQQVIISITDITSSRNLAASLHIAA